MRTLRNVALLVTLLAGSGTVIGCGGDDPVGAAPMDAGKDGPADQPIDGDAPDNNPLPPLVDGGDGGGRDFAAYVIDLVQNQTKETTAPTTDLCDLCTDHQDQKDFASLFP